jgi:hypothetical protein
MILVCASGNSPIGEDTEIETGANREEAIQNFLRFIGIPRNGKVDIYECSDIPVETLRLEIQAYPDEPPIQVG